MHKPNPITDTKLYEPATVKAALCKHFNLPSDKSDLTACERRFPGLGGGQIHYYLFALKDGSVRCQAFGKLGGPNVREYQALQHLMRHIPAEQGLIGRPIALLQDENRSMLLLEYLEGHSNAFSMLHSLRLFPNRVSNITSLGKDILDKLYSLQKHFPVTYSPLSSKDVDAIPGQPLPTGMFKRLEEIKSLSNETKSALGDRINELLKQPTAVRRGVIHGQLGMRNIMLNGSHIVFIDWEYMEPEGFSLFDPCYIATMILMKGAQLLISRSKLDAMRDFLFQHIEDLEESLTDAKNKQLIPDGLWFAKHLTMIDTLWEYERTGNRGLKALLGQGRRKIEYLAHCITEDSRNRRAEARFSNGGSPIRLAP